MLQYYLTENLMTAAPDDCMAQVTNVRSYTNEEIAELMLQRGTLLTKADILAVLEVYREVVLFLLKDGNAINTPLFNCSPSISGVFEGAADGFDSSRHKVKININTGIDLRKIVSDIKVEKVQVVDPVPYIVEAKDIVSGLVNDTLTPGGVLQLNGSRLKFIESNPDNGIFLIPDSGSEMKLTVIAENKPARLMAMLPTALAAGTYTIEVRTNLIGSSKEGKTLKKGRFSKLLTV